MGAVLWFDRLSGDDLERVRGLLRAAHDRDGRPEVVARTGPLPREFRAGMHGLLSGPDAALAGYVHVDTEGDARGRPVAELIVHPDRRGQGLGSVLAESLVSQVTRRPLRVWAHGDHPAAARIAHRLGFARVRELLKMRLDLAAGEPPLPAPSWPPGVRLRTFVPGQDEPAVVAVNRRAFDWHPEQGALTVADVAAAEDEPWFDPEGFFLAVDGEDRLLGFHWTKVHSGTPPEGEVYVVGVDPDAQGGGLGRALTLAGLHHLHRAGLATVVLYVESDNAPAVTVYRRLGFGLLLTDVQYEHG
ncbi:mycothiol synthase [Actinophytocola sp.]|uniref:mycothiol synthase n=1 Tax=Actinophytocola sp. TaxID=1872138 RepID=UPI002D80061C|nr:mycothiol synthase [Actinophytocola sp.]HET9144378.1 mycothiol synthase [Actinophytocola sp.]